ncbi:MAG TPA: bifunctional DNA-formamidopyrimidine glycosylase/DNA-(apurinic or apyrimidinic site) lyase [Gemmataceae bacterium]|jgi:formamidopyrimidine-DNA glycosylase|nr:bifunctional DNA-formamidopyrimidine glycosylase/DNA-(apurinic or apyrimidinic site) lyase [Gemmataceae bacterium]
MPELPEVETVASHLREHLIGRTVVGLVRSQKNLRQKWLNSWKPKILGRRVVAIDRRGKWLLVELDDAGHLMVHLGMSGQLAVKDPSDQVDQHTHLVVHLDDQHELRFRDPRRFGSVSYFSDRAECDRYLAVRLGPEPWNVVLSTFQAALNGTRRSIKAVLLDQTLIAGVGNIYADEASFAARVDPKRAGNSLRPNEARRLLSSIRRVLDQAIRNGGTTFDGVYSGGRNQHKLKAYGRTGEPCPRCGTAIECVRLAGRSTHYCPHCQR